MQTTIEQNRVRERRYEQEREYYRFEEATDIAERIGYPIDHMVHYEMRDGLAWSTSDKEPRPFRELTDSARRLGRQTFTGVNEFEAIRREHEHQEALMVDKFGRGDMDGTVLIKISPVPDAVRDGTARIDGYRRDLLRSFVRVYYRTEQGVTCRLFSLDQSDRIGLAAVGDYLGIDTDNRSSEDILSDYALVDIENVSHGTIGDLIVQTKSIYDGALELQTGKKFYAGSKFADKDDALSIVQGNGLLLNQHVDEVSKIMNKALDPAERKKLLEERRKRTAAAIDLRRKGVDVASVNDAAVTEQMSRQDYGGECATDTLTEVGMNQGRSGEKSEEKWMTCPFCGLQTYGDPCATRLVCNMCAAEVRNGQLVSKGIGRLNALALAEMQMQAKVRDSARPETKKKLSPTEIARRTYGPNASIEYVRGVGDAHYRVIHKDSGEVIGTFKP